MQSRVSAALVFEGYVRYFGSLHPAFEMSCDTEYLEETAFDFFGNVVFIVLDCVLFLKVSVQIFEKCPPMSPKPINLPFRMTLRAAQSLSIELCLGCFSSCD